MSAIEKKYKHPLSDCLAVIDLIVGQLPQSNQDKICLMTNLSDIQKYLGVEWDQMKHGFCTSGFLHDLQSQLTDCTRQRDKAYEQQNNLIEQVGDLIEATDKKDIEISDCKSKLEACEGWMKKFRSVSDLWCPPKEVEPEHEGEAQVLNKILEALNDLLKP